MLWWHTGSLHTQKLTSELSSWPSSSSERSNFTSSPPPVPPPPPASVVTVFEADIPSVDAPGSADNSSAASSNSTHTYQERMGVSIQVIHLFSIGWWGSMSKYIKIKDGRFWAFELSESAFFIVEVTGSLSGDVVVNWDRFNQSGLRTQQVGVWVGLRRVARFICLIFYCNMTQISIRMSD